MGLINYKRYAIYLADLNPTRGSEINKVRPVVIISMDEMNDVLDTVVVCPLTTKIHPHWKCRIQIVCAGKKAEIAVDQIRTISKNRIQKRMNSLSVSAAARLRQIISEMYGNG